MLDTPEREIHADSVADLREMLHLDSRTDEITLNELKEEINCHLRRILNHN